MRVATGPDLNTLLALFPPATYLRAPESVPDHRGPGPSQRLLVPPHHMTVTVEKHHGGLVDVVVLERRLEGNTYARKILLALQETGRIVQFGLVRIRLEYCSEQVRQAILAQDTPLGRILI